MQSAVGSVKSCVPFENAVLIYCTLHTDSPDGSTDAVARHVSFSQITCVLMAYSRKMMDDAAAFGRWRRGNNFFYFCSIAKK